MAKLIDKIPLSETLYPFLLNKLNIKQSEISESIDELKTLLKIYSAKAAAFLFTSKLISWRASKLLFSGDEGQAVLGFSCDFEDGKRVVEHYAEHVRNEVLAQYRKKKSKYYAPYFTVFQSSGYGKNRLMLEAGKRHLNTV